MNAKDFSKDGRCKDCEYAKIMSAGNWSFIGRKHKPYRGKWVAEIKDCPKRNEQTANQTEPRWCTFSGAYDCPIRNQEDTYCEEYLLNGY